MWRNWFRGDRRNTSHHGTRYINIFPFVSSALVPPHPPSATHSLSATALRNASDPPPPYPLCLGRSGGPFGCSGSGPATRASPHHTSLVPRRSPAGATPFTRWCHAVCHAVRPHTRTSSARTPARRWCHAVRHAIRPHLAGATPFARTAPHHSPAPDCTGASPVTATLPRRSPAPRHSPALHHPTAPRPTPLCSRTIVVPLAAQVCTIRAVPLDCTLAHGAGRGCRRTGAPTPPVNADAGELKGLQRPPWITACSQMYDNTPPRLPIPHLPPAAPSSTCVHAIPFTVPFTAPSDDVYEQ
ncbi:hypothetical protein GGX14DRAFT_559271 [Mycena pura]|uniref:Uncharacterized protein n=1 Tax=Mycena pura TaxID=153505 RepID=A0AAD6VSB4_9AGAR|nr:hypothetical protein GGX14DRAFT_559271 [Mycena pura]